MAVLTPGGTPAPSPTAGAQCSGPARHVSRQRSVPAARLSLPGPARRGAGAARAPPRPPGRAIGSGSSGKVCPCGSRGPPRIHPGNPPRIHPGPLRDPPGTPQDPPQDPPRIHPGPLRDPPRDPPRIHPGPPEERPAVIPLRGWQRRSEHGEGPPGAQRRPPVPS
ncbi:basic proline-rich protein-like [Manacus candei]|uniref:basic proline-rich protein-like n=1 Tax=Manacus candei TaxID=415023 RepID=UPI0022273913|nr:basic proline-rich protein-like [Manacus candei]